MGSWGTTSEGSWTPLIAKGFECQSGLVSNPVRIKRPPKEPVSCDDLFGLLGCPAGS